MNKVSQLYIVSVWGLRTPSAVCGPQGAVLRPPGEDLQSEVPWLRRGGWMGGGPEFGIQ